jgi:hypothetical protein
MAATSQGRFIYSLRYIPDEIDRAKLRTTLLYLFSDRVRAGIEWNPLADDASILVNVHVVREGKRKPAVIFGLSSDRIGTPFGKSLFLTASRDFRIGGGVSIAPYVGAAHGTYEDKTRAIGGVNLRFSKSLSALAIFDGVRLHEVISFEKGSHGLSAVFIRNGRRLGVSYNVVF